MFNVQCSMLSMQFSENSISCYWRILNISVFLCYPQIVRSRYHFQMSIGDKKNLWLNKICPAPISFSLSFSLSSISTKHPKHTCWPKIGWETWNGFPNVEKFGLELNNISHLCLNVDWEMRHWSTISKSQTLLKMNGFECKIQNPSYNIIRLSDILIELNCTRIETKITIQNNSIEHM